REARPPGRCPPGGIFDERPLDAGPEPGGIPLLVELGGGPGERLPSIHLGPAARAPGGVRFERRPLFARAVEKDPFAVAALNVQGARPASRSRLRGASSICRRFFLAWNKVFFDAVSLMSSTPAISECRKPSTSYSRKTSRWWRVSRSSARSRAMRSVGC